VSVLPGVLYFVLVFGAGFILGPIRVLWLVPRLGERWAELIELPVMVVAIVLAARFVVRRLAVPPTTPARLMMGGSGLVLTLAAECALVQWLRGMTPADYFSSRDPVSGTAYGATLLFFAALPLLLARRR
jgi:hypothetical protein